MILAWLMARLSPILGALLVVALLCIAGERHQMNVLQEALVTTNTKLLEAMQAKLSCENSLRSAESLAETRATLAQQAMRQAEETTKVYKAKNARLVNAHNKVIYVPSPGGTPIGDIEKLLNENLPS